VAYFPVYLDLEGRLAVVVGRTALAEVKAQGLAAAGARVRRIAPEDLQDGDLDEAALVIVTDGEPEVRDAVFAAATARNILINTVDDLPRCNWIAPSIVRRGDLTVAISTAGKAPALAVRLRQWLEREIGPEHGRFLEMAGAVRGELARQQPDFERRRELWYRLVDSDVLEKLGQGREDEARRRFVEILGVAPPRPEQPPPAEQW
jgi:siroheme synthase-like protein